jgi:peptidoglycan/LPS O-acetylase OafA/YrhL
MARAARDPAQRYGALDAIRGVAAIMVVFLHSSRLFEGQWAPGGYLAVDLFFALSGFVIAHAYDRRLGPQSGQGLSGGKFVVLRLIRFWPLYALGLGIGLVHQLLLLATHNDHAIAPQMLLLAVMLALLFVPAPVQGNGNLFPMNVPSWSLFLELLVNAAYGFAFSRLSVRVIGVIAAVGGVAFTILCLHHGEADLGANVQTLDGGVARTLFSFSLGVLIYRQGWRPFRLPVPLLLGLVVLFLAMPVPSEWRAIYDIVFVLLVSPLIVAVGATSSENAPPSRIGEFIGLLSFPVYAVHRPLIDLFTPIAEKLHLPLPVKMAVFLIGLGLFCACLDRLYDRPARKMLARLLGRRPEPPLPERSLP